jgi:NAD(P)-dependent dehydrogenase (short-subunit alcohol dehydrogenase family)
MWLLFAISVAVLLIVLLNSGKIGSSAVQAGGGRPRSPGPPWPSVDGLVAPASRAELIWPRGRGADAGGRRRLRAGAARLTRLDQRVAIVTGAGQGIGRKIAEGLAGEGARVVVADVRGGEQAAQAIGGLAVEVDVSDLQDCERMARAAVDAYGRIDILVNNAGIYTSLVPTPFDQLSVDEWRRVFDVNVLGMYLATRAVAPFMRSAGTGRIINLASGTPYKGVPMFLHYVASKGAVIAMTRSLAKELGGDGVLVNTVAPGFTMSDGVLANQVQVQQLRDISVGARVLVRDQYPEDIVGAVVFFASDDSSFITGQSLVVDGGAYFN